MDFFIAILAGGKSDRFGSNKAIFKIDGIPIISKLLLEIPKLNIKPRSVFISLHDKSQKDEILESIRAHIKLEKTASSEFILNFAGKSEEVKIPLIAAGGVFNGEDIIAMLRAGAKGVQMATRFVATKECDADQKFKDAYLKATKDDIVMIKSPVGLPGRALRTVFTEKILVGEAPKPDPLECKGCIGDVCNKSYCILKALENARKGDLDNGLVFAGSNVWRVDQILSVEELIKELTAEANKILSKEPLLI